MLSPAGRAGRPGAAAPGPGEQGHPPLPGTPRVAGRWMLAGDLRSRCDAEVTMNRDLAAATSPDSEDPPVTDVMSTHLVGITPDARWQSPCA
jgi:hypothetical protein